MGNNSLDALVVDDEKAMGDIFDKYLSGHGINFKIVTKVQEAIDIVKKEKPKMAMVDIFLPELDGFDLAEEIYKVSPDTNIILMSGIYDFTQDHLKNLGIEYFIKKPIDFSQVDKILKKLNLI